MNIEALLTDLRKQRDSLEWEYAGRRSQLDRVISRIEREVNPDPATTGVEVPPSAPAPDPEPQPDTPKPRQPRKSNPASNGKPKSPGTQGVRREAASAHGRGVAASYAKLRAEMGDLKVPDMHTAVGRGD